MNRNIAEMSGSQLPTDDANKMDWKKIQVDQSNHKNQSLSIKNIRAAKNITSPKMDKNSIYNAGATKKMLKYLKEA